MDVMVFDDYEAMSKMACQWIIDRVAEKPDAVLGLATGSTPLGTYRELISSYHHKKIDFRFVSTFNLDEYVGLGRDHPQSYRAFMERELFRYINLSDENTHIPDGMQEDLQAECVRYESLVEKIGPPDLQILGIGENGHIGFNEPGSLFKSETHIVELTESTRSANARFFEAQSQVPSHAITMGIQSILKSKLILLLASGERKTKAIKRLLQMEEPKEAFPASALLRHPNVTLIIDQQAYGKKGRNP